VGAAGGECAANLRRERAEEGIPWRTGARRRNGEAAVLGGHEQDPMQRFIGKWKRGGRQEQAVPRL
jgi:hypothetical protein